VEKVCNPAPILRFDICKKHGQDGRATKENIEQLALPDAFRRGEKILFSFIVLSATE